MVTTLIASSLFWDDFATDFVVSVLGSLMHGKAIRFGFGIILVRKTLRNGFGITLVRKSPSFRFWDDFGTEKPHFGCGITLIRKKAFPSQSDPKTNPFSIKQRGHYICF